MHLREPSAALPLVPRRILQRSAPEPRPVVVRRRTRVAVAILAIHVGFAAAFAAFLIWRPLPEDLEAEVPVDVEFAPEKPKAEAEKPAPEAPKPAPRQALAETPLQPPPAPDPHPPAPPAVQPPPSGQPTAPALLAPPPEPARAKTAPDKTEEPNAVPDAAAAPQAKREATPAGAPEVLSGTSPKAAFAVPPPEPAKPKPAPPAPAAKAPSETEKLAAALPMDTRALPDTFRAVLSGNGAAVDSAYKGLVYSRFSHAAEIGERARQQHLQGQVIVSFTIDDDGGIKSLAVLQSSGNPALDALGLEMIRSAAPFPPPPPGAQRSFTPALAFGG